MGTCPKRVWAGHPYDAETFPKLKLGAPDQVSLLSERSDCLIRERFFGPSLAGFIVALLPENDCNHKYFTRKHGEKWPF
jgi:hypothetical protein